jgi:hypothetical protein
VRWKAECDQGSGKEVGGCSGPATIHPRQSRRPRLGCCGTGSRRRTWDTQQQTQTSHNRPAITSNQANKPVAP